jgi:hypothetical protein
MTQRSMADDSSEQVPGQQTNESSLDHHDERGGEESGGDDVGLGRDASSN